MERNKRRQEEDIREDQTFQDGTLDDGTAEEQSGRKSPEGPELERDHGHVGETDEEEGEEMGEVVVKEE